VNAPVIGSIADPIGAPDSEKDNVFAGTSESVAVAVNVIGDSSSPDCGPIGERIGASLTGVMSTVTNTSKKLLSSETRSVKESTPFAFAFGV